jgi:glycosyltransferase involved in cell wall biosynthesis
MLKRLLARLRKAGYEDFDDFDPQWYLSEYPDVARDGADPLTHYRLFGKKEGRFPNEESKRASMREEAGRLREYMCRNLREGLSMEGLLETASMPADLLEGLDPDELRRLNPLHASCSDEELLSRLLQIEGVFLLRLGLDEEEEAVFYRRVAEHYLALGDLSKSRELLLYALYLFRDAKALEYMGNIFFTSQEYDKALLYYEKALEDSEKAKSIWLYINMMESLCRVGESDRLVSICKLASQEYPLHTLLGEKMDESIGLFMQKTDSRMRVLSSLEEREALLECSSVSVKRIAGMYRNFFEVCGLCERRVGSADGVVVTIVADMHIPQCVRYRVEQKRQQLEYVGIEVDAIAWEELEESRERVLLSDIVIFYRVPAFALVIKYIEKLRTLGKTLFYEIDDLIFDPIYPPPYESYGGSIDMQEYNGLLYGMPLFRECAGLCEYGIGSTVPIVEKLAERVASSKAFLHRNGLDPRNSFLEKREDEYVDIFYGSATLAHNSDFLELVLKPLERVMESYPEVRLHIVGHLNLPEKFLRSYPGRVLSREKTESVEEYWELLRSADINLAVLHSDPLNDAKSELKWFEAACFKIPSVVSATRNYLDVVEDGRDALVASCEDEWYEALESLVCDEELRNRIGERAYEKVVKEYSIERLGGNISDILSEISKDAIAKRAKRRKIAFVNVFFHPQSIGGATRVVEDQVRILQSEYGDEFEGVVFTTDSEANPDIYRLDAYASGGVAVYRATLPFRERMDWYPEDGRMKELFADFLAYEKPELVHFHSIQRIGAGALEACREAGIPYFVTLHDAWWICDYQFLTDERGELCLDMESRRVLRSSLPEGVGAHESQRRREYLGKMLHGASAIMAVSKSFAEIYSANEVAGVEVLENGITDSLEWNCDTPQKERVVCAHIGGMSEHKGYHILKEAVERVKPVNMEFLVVDHSRGADYEISGRWAEVPVRYVGRVPQKEMERLYSGINILFAPSVWPESFGLVTREAAACGRWIVASDRGGIGEVVRDGVNGFVVEPSVEALCEVIERIDSEPERYKKRAPRVDIPAASTQMRKLVSKYRRELSIR